VAKFWTFSRPDLVMKVRGVCLGGSLMRTLLLHRTLRSITTRSTTRRPQKYKGSSRDQETVMSARSVGQNGSLDIALTSGGIDTLHPAGKGTLEQLGHDHIDVDRVIALVKNGAMHSKVWSN
jgi:hypothetical protein